MTRQQLRAARAVRADGGQAEQDAGGGGGWLASPHTCVMFCRSAKVTFVFKCGTAHMHHEAAAAPRDMRRALLRLP